MSEVIRLSPGETQYPPGLRYAFGGLVPPDIWYVGNVDLLGGPGVGFCGSREASELGLQVAAGCAAQLVAAGVSVISGYAPGVDMASHEAALAGGGRTILVLAEGIEHFRVKKSIQPHWDWRRVLVISQFSPNAPWRADRAMERNKIIVALSNAVIVLEARDKGGTLNAGYCALQMTKPLFVALYGEMNGAREGNQRLLRDGGKPLQRNRTTGVPEMRGVFEVLAQIRKSSDIAGNEGLADIERNEP